MGALTTQDESGTAAYKTVELDDHLGGAPVQHREVEGHESGDFLALFKGPIQILSGGIDSGFNHVKPEEFVPRLLHLKGLVNNVRVTEVPAARTSLNSGDVFILDTGLILYQWNGKNSSGGERVKAGQLCRAIDDSRRGLPKIEVLDEGEDHPVFWSHLEGGAAPVQSAEAAGLDNTVVVAHTPKLFRLSTPVGSSCLHSSAKQPSFPRPCSIHQMSLSWTPLSRCLPGLERAPIGLKAERLSGLHSDTSPGRTSQPIYPSNDSPKGTRTLLSLLSSSI